VFPQVISPILDVLFCLESWYFCPEQGWCAREGGRPGKRKTEEVKQKGYKEILGKRDIDCMTVETVLCGRQISCVQLVRHTESENG